MKNAIAWKRQWEIRLREPNKKRATEKVPETISTILFSKMWEIESSYYWRKDVQKNKTFTHRAHMEREKAKMRKTEFHACREYCGIHSIIRQTIRSNSIYYNVSSWMHSIRIRILAAQIHMIIIIIIMPYRVFPFAFIIILHSTFSLYIWMFAECSVVVIFDMDFINARPRFL